MFGGVDGVLAGVLRLGKQTDRLVVADGAGRDAAELREPREAEGSHQTMLRLVVSAHCHCQYGMRLMAPPAGDSAASNWVGSVADMGSEFAGADRPNLDLVGV